MPYVNQGLLLQYEYIQLYTYHTLYKDYLVSVAGLQVMIFFPQECFYKEHLQIFSLPDQKNGCSKGSTDSKCFKNMELSLKQQQKKEQI